MPNTISIPLIIASQCKANQIEEIIIEPVEPYYEERYKRIRWSIQSPDRSIPADIESQIMKWADKTIDQRCTILLQDRSVLYAGKEWILIFETPAD